MQNVDLERMQMIIIFMSIRYLFSVIRYEQW